MKRLIVIIISCFMLACNLDEDTIRVVNESSYPIWFNFTTGYLTEEYFLNRGQSRDFSLLKTYSHEMGAIISPRPVNYTYYNNTYTFKNAYTVTFNVNGGKGTAPAKQTAFVNDTIILPSGNGFSRDFYRFDGWTITGTSYPAGSEYSSPVSNNITCSAKWVEIFKP